MAVGKEIRNKIKSVTNTQKITSAMEMVAASKMRKTQEQMERSRPYVAELLHLAANLSEATKEDYEHSYFEVRETIKRVGIIVVSSDRGLCGGLNNNLFKVVSEKLAQCHAGGIEVDIATIGNKARQFFGRHGGHIIASHNVTDEPSSSELIGFTTAMLKRFESGEIDELHLFTNEFVNTMTQKPTGKKILPLVADDILYQAELNIAKKKEMSWDYLYESNPETLIDFILRRYIEFIVYQGVVENIACEMAARMIAMKAASDNAGELIDKLQLIYNKARQAAITQEISEIVGGAAAIS